MQEEPSFSVRLQGLGVFPKPSFPRVVWVGVTEGSERVDALHVRADELLKTLGFPPDERFHPHATVVRVKYVADKGKLARFLEGEKNSDYGTYTADRVSLMESKLSPEGPKYNTLKDYSLKCA
jgi:2'-5' RNA ligase